MTVNFTVSGTTNVDITSASVSLPDEESSSSSSSESISHQLQASVSRSQATVVGKNFETRVLAISRAPARGGIAAPNTGGVPAPTTGDQPSSSSFSAPASSTTAAKPAMVMKSRGTSLRELAMQASFDSSQTTLSAAGDANTGDDPLRGIEQSLGLLADSGFTVWGHGSYTSVDNDRNNAAGDSRYDGDVWGYNLGVDMRLRPELVGGISMGYSQTALTTTYNSGYYDETNWTLSPYVVYQPADGVTLSTIIGYSLGDIDLSRDSSVRGNTDSGMWFGSLSGAYVLRPSETLPLDVTVNVSFMAARKTVDGYTESDGTQVGKTVSNTRRLKPGVEAAYSFDAAGTTLQPFAKTDFVYDMTDETNGDKTAFNLGGGLRIISSATGLSGSIEGEQQLGTDDYSEYTIGGLIAYTFALSGSEGTSLGIVSPYVRSNFNPDSGQTFGTGFTFTAEDGAFSSEVNLTHTNAVSSSETVAQVSVAFPF
ncbi:autotransporter outer membrane beta-barrel domain-containing protein [Thalassospira sp. HJ]|uniref:autotransporter outer membrane beta-barrel domain-containing protein n=1 Tax=Thalassospira sp. HJ TaxID=1616823 RepID=UPI0013792740|nr:autotransporter outer membrane beta-barrel domain-containing protein [Thalassospira sp. HJ]